jgi:hypothetical protein
MSTCGTQEGAYIWCNTTDNTGIVFAGVVWVFFLFAIYFLVDVVYLVSEDYKNGFIISVLIFMALWSHTMTMMSDPGSVPSNAHPVASDKSTQIAMCGRCDGYKPYKSHHGDYWLIFLWLTCVILFYRSRFKPLHLADGSLLSMDK